VLLVPQLIAEALSPSAELLFPREVGDFSSCCCRILTLRSSITKSFARFVIISEDNFVSPIYAGQLPLVFSSRGLGKRSLFVEEDLIVEDVTNLLILLVGSE
jgi:hypothetical protein